MQQAGSLSPISTLVTVSLLLAVALIADISLAQSKGVPSGARRSVTLNVIVHAPPGKQVSKDDFDLYDANVIQEVENFGRLDVGSRVVLLVDSSASLKVESTALQKAVLDVVNELFSDDQMMVVGYNEVPEIIEEMTPDLSKLQATPNKLVRKGFPNLFDALIAVSDAFVHQAKTGVEKRAIILISDGYDSDSKTKFDDALNELQDANVVLYAIQAPDRTRGSLVRGKPKPPSALAQLTGGTGGAIFPFDKASEAARSVSEDLRNNWYRLVYTPSGVNTINTRRLLLMPRAKGLELRTKGSHPGRYH
jgi:VWFA-related protein